MSSLQARTFSRTAGTAVNHAARLELLEQYLAHYEDIVRCAQVSLEWLGRHAGVKQSACLAVDAESDDDAVMALSHKTRPIFGIQFHPESYGTEGGDQIVINFLKKAQP